VCASKILRKGGFPQIALSKVHSYENPFLRSLKNASCKRIFGFKI
jgi:hypothetical protein